jgi:hypothetical protein
MIRIKKRYSVCHHNFVSFNQGAFLLRATFCFPVLFWCRIIIIRSSNSSTSSSSSSNNHILMYRTVRNMRMHINKVRGRNAYGSDGWLSVLYCTKCRCCCEHGICSWHVLFQTLTSHSTEKSLTGNVPTFWNMIALSTCVFTSHSRVLGTRR